MPQSLRNALRLLKPQYDRSSRGHREYADSAKTVRQTSNTSETDELPGKKTIHDEQNGLKFFAPTDESLQSSHRIGERYPEAFKSTEELARRGLRLVHLGFDVQIPRFVKSYSRFKADFERGHEGRSLARGDYELGLRAAMEQMLTEAEECEPKLKSIKHATERLLGEEKEYWKGR